MKIRYVVDPKAPKTRQADKTLAVDRSLFSRFTSRNYIIRSAEQYSTTKTIKIICKQNREIRFFVRSEAKRHEPMW